MRKTAFFTSILLAVLWCIPQYGVFSVQQAAGASRYEQERQGGTSRQSPNQLRAQTNYAGDIMSLTNAERRKARLPELVADNELVAATALRARELATRFAHTRPDGSSFDTVLREFRVRPYKSWGENILYNMHEAPADAVKTWMNSPGHRANILNKGFTHTGVGVHRSGGKTYVVQIFVGR